MMKRYDKYKPSGVEWIGDIPINWSVKKLKYVGESIIGITYSPDDVTTDESGILVLRSSNIQNGALAFDDNVFIKKEIQPKYYTKAGDILLCARNGSAHLVGKSAFIDEKSAGTSFGAFMTIFRSAYGKFLYYFFNSQIFKSQTGLFSTSTINQLTSDTLNNMLFAFPPDLEEQTAIANYLDKKTAQIDDLIAKKQKLIEALKEERTAIINDAVSGKGKSWDKKKLKYLAKLRNEEISQSDFKIAVENIESGSARLINLNEKQSYQGALAAFKKGDTIFNKLRPYLHKVYLAERDGGIYGELLILYSLGELIPEFLFYKLFSKSFVDIVDGSTQGTKMPRANWDSFISHLLVEFPMDKKEQVQIVTHIQSATQKIDNTISKINKEIELINEYRIAMISEVVTGKIDVRKHLQPKQLTKTAMVNE